MSESGVHGMLPASQKVLERGRCYGSQSSGNVIVTMCVCLGGGMRGQGERERREVRRRIRGKKGKEKE